ncbi:MAG: topoisomerase, partial [Clostridiales bacterium]|nr:topoisomerase [Clostridiales bacterium]
MPRITAEQLEHARQVDLLTYLRANEPSELVKSGRNEYRTATHGSLVISNGKWVWNRAGFGGR